ncbi:D-alanine--D-alanine ligase family protein [Streptomyces lonarensis]|uniref:D-alanine--D-alanine ligase n=1 Tax=Streptomyces lonarensis TaxID=700599 RepID=A0A7X6I0C5_9ACTN|nr:D-alanine--D-alanine ligase family protein [Streptomyces lonarensis]NJQ07561.1 D-alanine--D-alanine ligase [Streptomyces lonarensis]
MSSQHSSQSPKPRVAVVFGGRSSEHAISVVTAGAVLRSIDRERYEVLPVGITAEGRWALAADEPDRMAIADRRLPAVTDLTDEESGSVLLPMDAGGREVIYTEPGAVPKALGEVDVVFPVLHGPYGEDGTLQGLLELSGVPYVGCGVLASAVGMDKEYMKRVFVSFGLPVGPYEVLRPAELRRDPAAARGRVLGLAERYGWPLFVKPARAGSSMGISKVEGPEALDAAIEEAQRHDPKVIVETLLRGREIECGVLEFEDGPRASVPAEIPPVSGYDFYDFEAKYIDSAQGIVPAALSEEETARVRELAVRAFEALSCEGLARADFFLQDDGSLVINEVNTLPGFTPISMFPRMWEQSGMSYEQLVDHLITTALNRSAGLR